MSDPYADFNSRQVTKWLERKIRESMRQSMRTLVAQLKAEQAKHGLPGKE